MEKQPLIPASAEAEPSIQDLQSRVEEARTTAMTAQRDLFSAQQNYSQAWARTPRGRIFRTIFFTFLIALFALPLSGLLYLGLTDDDEVEEYLPRRIPLEAHIMSKCPDARDCLHDLVLPAMVNVSHLVDFKLSYIGTPTDSDDGVLCKHGASECLGNTLELCAAHLYRDPKIYLGFTMCLSKEYTDIPSEQLVHECALEHGINFGKLNHCVSSDDGQKGIELLRSSVQRSATHNVTTSCTVRVNDKIWCVRDGGEWKDCESGHEPRNLVDEILETRWQHSAGKQ